MFDPYGDQPVSGQVLPPGTDPAWQQMEADRQEAIREQERLAAEEAAIITGLAILGRWRQSRQPRYGTPEQVAAIERRRTRNGWLTLAAIVAFCGLVFIVANS